MKVTSKSQNIPLWVLNWTVCSLYAEAEEGHHDSCHTGGMEVLCFPLLVISATTGTWYVYVCVCTLFVCLCMRLYCVTEEGEKISCSEVKEPNGLWMLYSPVVHLCGNGCMAFVLNRFVGSKTWEIGETNQLWQKSSAVWPHYSAVEKICQQKKRASISVFLTVFHHATPCLSLVFSQGNTRVWLWRLAMKLLQSCQVPWDCFDVNW